MKRYLLLGVLALSACTEISGVSYTPPAGYVLVTNPNDGNHTWRRIEGKRVFFREKGQYSGTDLGSYFLDLNCANQTYRVEGQKWKPLRDLPPDSIGRGAFWDVCGGN